MPTAEKGLFQVPLFGTGRPPSWTKSPHESVKHACVSFISWVFSFLLASSTIEREQYFVLQLKALWDANMAIPLPMDNFENNLLNTKGPLYQMFP